MGTFVGILLIITAAISVGAVFVYVAREKHEHQEYYIPGQNGDSHPQDTPAAEG
jgi:hypothetical protein